jgi:hypothetical protein
MTMKGFKVGIEQVFGDIDKKHTAVRCLQGLKQRGSATMYTAEFRQHAVRVGWNDQSLYDQYYKGLKDHVKDEIARSDVPDSLNDLIVMAIKINNRYYERAIERKGLYTGHQNRSDRKSYGSDLMELDAA